MFDINHEKPFAGNQQAKEKDYYTTSLIDGTIYEFELREENLNFVAHMKEENTEQQDYFQNFLLTHFTIGAFHNKLDNHLAHYFHNLFVKFDFENINCDTFEFINDFAIDIMYDVYDSPIEGYTTMYEITLNWVKFPY